MPTIVIVDDEYIVVDGIKAMIARESSDFEVVGFAYNGIDGVKEIIEKQPDVVITDIRMPGMDGLELIEKINEIGIETIFVVLSGYQEFEYARKALCLNVKGYIDKPITVEKVREILEMSTQVLCERRGSLEHKINYRNKSNQLIYMIEHGIWQGYSEVLSEVLKSLKEYMANTEEYKKEIYKLLCMGLGIYYEQRKKLQEEEHFPSYANIESLGSLKEVDELVTTLFTRLFYKIREKNIGNMHRTVKVILEEIQSNYHLDIGLTELADKYNMNPAYLSNLFKEEVGMSYVKYLTKLRIDKAKELLTEGEGKKVSEVSDLIGYSNYRYFCDIFKKYTGQTPNEYKKTMK